MRQLQNLSKWSHQSLPVSLLPITTFPAPFSGFDFHSLTFQDHLAWVLAAVTIIRNNMAVIWTRDQRNWIDFSCSWITLNVNSVVTTGGFVAETNQRRAIWTYDAWAGKTNCRTQHSSEGDRSIWPADQKSSECGKMPCGQSFHCFEL